MATKVQLLARVECRCEGAAEERPVAVACGGSRFPICEVVDDVTVGPEAAGGRHRRRVTVAVEELGRLILDRELPDGEWRVFQAGT